MGVGWEGSPPGSCGFLMNTNRNLSSYQMAASTFNESIHRGLAFRRDTQTYAARCANGKGLVGTWTYSPKNMPSLFEQFNSRNLF